MNNFDGNTKSQKQFMSNKNNGDEERSRYALDKKGEAFPDHQVERQSAAIRVLRDVELEQLRTMLGLLRSYFSKEQLQVPVLHFVSEQFPNLCIGDTGKDGLYEVKWKDRHVNLPLNPADERTLHASLLHRLSISYCDYSVDVQTFGGFEFPNKSVKTGFLGATKLPTKSLVLEEPSDSQMPEMIDGLQTLDASNNRLSVGMTPKSFRLPKRAEMVLSVHGSPLGVYNDDNMETIQGIMLSQCHFATLRS